MRFYLCVLAEGMGVDPQWFLDLLDNAKGETAAEHEPVLPEPDNTTSAILRVMKYDSETSGEIGDGGRELLCEAHLDVGFVTIDPCTLTPGLEAEDCDGNWQDMEGNRTYATEANLLIGETFSKITNGYYPATNHRVYRPPPGIHRIAMPFLMRGRPDAVIDTRTAKRIKSKRPGVLSKFKTVTIRQLPNIDAAKVLVRMVLKDQLSQFKADKDVFKKRKEADEAKAELKAKEEEDKNNVPYGI